MNFTLDVLILKQDIEKTNISELLVEWGGEIFSQNPPKYSYNSNFTFIQLMNMKYYESFVGDALNIENYMALRLQGKHTFDLEIIVNNQIDEINNNELILFFYELFKLDTFTILLIRDEECIDKKYKISEKQELTDIILSSFNWSSLKGVLITKQ